MGRSGDFEIVTYPNGSASLREKASGEVMHSVIGAWQEAELLYVRQSGLARRLALPAPYPVRALDVGMGIAANALCAVECRLELQGPARRLELHSFENELGGMELALGNPAAFPFVDRHREKVTRLLDSGVWDDPYGRVQWRLYPGDFFRNVRPEMKPELIFYDFYAPRSCGPLWSVESLSQVHALGRERAAEEPPMELFTYSAGTPVRVALLLSGFFVGYGTATGSKAETTLASTRLDTLAKPLGQAWLEKLRRSTRAFPWGWPDQDFRKLEARILAHPQFAPPA